MNRLFESFLDMVKTNTSINDIKVQNIIAMSLLSLYLLKGSSILDDLPNVLSSLEIHYKDKSVNDALRRLGITKDYSLGRCMLSCVTNNIDDKGVIHHHLIIPMNDDNENLINTIERVTHELVHILRFRDVKTTHGKIVFHEGIATKKIDSKSMKKEAKYEILEEAIVQDTAKNATKLLIEYHKDFDRREFFKEFKKSIPTYESILYKAHVILLNYLKRDNHFSYLIDHSFIVKSPNYLKFYYNSIMDDNNAFNRLDNLFRNMNTAIEDNNSDLSIKYTNMILEEIDKYLKKQKILKK